MKKLYIVTTVGSFDMETSDIGKARKILYDHASRHPNIKMGIYELVHSVKLSKYVDGRARWHSEFKVGHRKKKK